MSERADSGRPHIAKDLDNPDDSVTTACEEAQQRCQDIKQQMHTRSGVDVPPPVPLPGHETGVPQGTATDQTSPAGKAESKDIADTVRAASPNERPHGPAAPPTSPARIPSGVLLCSPHHHAGATQTHDVDPAILTTSVPPAEEGGDLGQGELTLDMHPTGETLDNAALEALAGSAGMEAGCAAPGVHPPTEAQHVPEVSHTARAPKPPVSGMKGTPGLVKRLAAPFTAFAAGLEDLGTDIVGATKTRQAPAHHTASSLAVQDASGRATGHVAAPSTGGGGLPPSPERVGDSSQAPEGKGVPEEHAQWAPVTGTITDVVYHLGRAAADAAQWLWTGKSTSGLLPSRVTQGPAPRITVSVSKGTLATLDGPRTAGAPSGTEQRLHRDSKEDHKGMVEDSAVAYTPGSIFQSLVTAVESVLPTSPARHASPEATAVHLPPPSHGFAAQGVREVTRLEHGVGGGVVTGANATSLLPAPYLDMAVQEAEQRKAHGVVHEKPLADMLTVPGIHLQDMGGYGRGVDPHLYVPEEPEATVTVQPRSSPGGRRHLIPVMPYTSTEELMAHEGEGREEGEKGERREADVGVAA